MIEWQNGYGELREWAVVGVGTIETEWISLRLGHAQRGG